MCVCVCVCVCSCGGAAGSDPEVNAEQQRQGDGMLNLVLHTSAHTAVIFYYIYKMHNMGMSKKGNLERKTQSDLHEGTVLLL